MGLFDFFRNKKSKKDSNSFKYPGFMVTESKPKKDHLLADSALYGFQNMELEAHEDLVYRMIDDALNQTAVEENPVYKICQSGTDKLMLRVLYIISSYHKSNYVANVFPYFKPNTTIQFLPHRLTEWDAAIEAEVEGEAQETFGLSFYAADYAINQSLYRSGQNLEVKISGLALVIDKNEPVEINGIPVSQDFAALLPNKEAGEICFYDFIGKLIHFEAHKVNEFIDGYILTLKLINHGDEDIFTIDVFANRQNMRITDLYEGMSLAGCLWLQGEAVKIIT
jgi:hypothetical protein